MTTTPPPADENHSAAELSLKKMLVLMRHAKSDWSDGSLGDHDRGLNARGQRDAPRMAQWLAQLEIVPDRILCSSAIRTRQTVSLMTPHWPSQPEVSYCQSLYLSAPETMLETINSDGLDAEVLMLVAHNPGTTHLVGLLAGSYIEMPTAAIAIFQVDLSAWEQLRSSTPAELLHYMRPKAL